MPSRTKSGLNLADKNSYVRVEENINDNLLKIDDDVDGTWGGLYGGYIQDETITKEIGKRYIDEFDKEAYICIKPSNINTEDAYTKCNVANNLDKLQNLFVVEKTLLFTSLGMWINFIKYNDFILADYNILDTLQPGVYQIQVPSEFLPTVKDLEMVETDVLGVYFRKTGLSVHVVREKPNSSFLATKTVIYK